HGVGPATARKMSGLGIETGLDLKGQTLEFLQQHFGKVSSYYYWAARGVDERPVRADRILTDDERLAAPSFEPMTAGISVGSDGFLFTTNDQDIVEDGAITYETIILDKEGNTPRAAPPVAITAEFLDRHITLGAAARSDVRHTGNAKYRVSGNRNALVRKGWTIVSTADGSAQPAPGLEAGKVVSYAETFQALQRLKQVNPLTATTLMLVRVAAP